MNNNRPKGNHKHLTQSDRIEIEKGLGNRESFRTIAKKLGKDPSTISKEVRLHREFVRRTGIKAKTPIPCANNYNPNNKKASACIEVQVCGDTGCLKKCVCCSKFKCSAVCPKYVPRTCELLDKPPYVCNGCANKTN